MLGIAQDTNQQILYPTRYMYLSGNHPAVRSPRNAIRAPHPFGSYTFARFAATTDRPQAQTEFTTAPKSS